MEATDYRWVEPNAVKIPRLPHQQPSFFCLSFFIFIYYYNIVFFFRNLWHLWWKWDEDHSRVPRVTCARTPPQSRCAPRAQISDSSSMYWKVSTATLGEGVPSPLPAATVCRLLLAL